MTISVDFPIKTALRCFFTVAMAVACDNPTRPAEIASVSVSVPRSAIRTGESIQADVRVMDAVGEPITGREISWTSSASAVAAVSAAGVITAVSPGTTRITATVEAKSASQDITVTAVPIASITLQPSDTTVTIGGSLQMRAATMDSAGRILSDRQVKWQVSDSSIAVISESGLLTAVSLGTVRVVATSEDRSTTSNVRVDRAPLSTAGRTLLFSSSIGVPDTTVGNTTYHNIPDIFVARDDGSDPVNLTSDPAYDLEASWSPDGKQIVFTSYRSNNLDLYTIRDDGTALRRITTAPEDDGQGRWSPDGRKILFYSRRDGTPLPGYGNLKPADLFVINADGSDVVNLTHTADKSETNPAWSPDGSKIAFVRTEYEIRPLCPGCALFSFIASQRFYIMNADGSNPIPFIELPSNYVPDFIAWSSDGRQIAYSVNDRNSPTFKDYWVIFVADADGSNAKPVTSLTGMARFPSWSPDGSRLFYSFSGEEFWGKLYTGVATVGVDGTGPRVVQFNVNRRALSDSPAAWRR